MKIKGKYSVVRLLRLLSRWKVAQTEYRYLSACS